MSLILRLVSSQHHKINVERFSKLCMDTSVFFISIWPKFKFSETVHALLAHAAQLVEINDGYGLGMFAEHALECNNSKMRLFIEKLSRKMTEYVVLEDAWGRMWVKSDVIIRSKDKQSFCTRCGVVGHYTVSCPKKDRIRDDTKLSLEYYLL